MENYEQKYNEALKSMRDLYDKMKYLSSTDALATTVTLENTFPELKESEDERIRKGLIRGLSAMKNIHNRQTFSDDAINIDDAIAWLEKQGEQKHKIQPKFKIGDIIRFKGNETLKGEVESHKIVGYDNELYVFADGTTDLFCEQELYELVEQKSADKVEPKFHKGEWITNGDYTWKIVEVKPLDYILQSQDGNIVDDTISHVDEQFHSFTIEDARDGDVLVTDKSVFIYAKVSYNKPYAYCGVDKFGVFKDSCLEHDWANSVDNIHPATKEQRDQLEKAMADAGYTFDFEKKELKKIEQNPTWSEEDEKKIELLINILKVNHPNEYFKVNPENTSTMEAMHTEEFVDWLKSLKPNHWKPSEEEMGALLYTLGMGGTYNKEALTRLYNDIKKL